MNARKTSLDPTDICFHCELPIPAGVRLGLRIEGVDRPMCCPGCLAVAEMIIDQDLLDYYRHREDPAPRPDGAAGDRSEEHRLYDDPAVQRGFVADSGDSRTASLSVEGIRCAACVWLIEHRLERIPGLQSAHVNLAAHRAHVRWDPERAKLSELLAAIDRLGYRARPFQPDRQEEIQRRQQRAALRRLGVAGLGMAQVMMFAVALYAGALEGMTDPTHQLLRWVSLLVASGVMLVAARPFFEGAWRDLRVRRLGMDVPVALALGGAYLASAATTLRGSGEVYFDSVCMFTFFLSLARYLELHIRRRSSAQLQALARSTVGVAHRLDEAGDKAVPIGALRPGDRVRVPAGETIPADGRIREGEAAVSEALLTGESLPRARRPGDRVLGGSQLVEGSLIVEVTRTGANSALSSVLALLDRAQSEKPAFVRLADRAAGHFVAAVIVASVGVAFYWWIHAPDQAFRIVLSVLVATCPCALSLATPAALAAATNGLASRGFLITRGHTLETLARVTHIVFDKTGTLTADAPRLAAVVPMRPRPESEFVALARALERDSRHPLARALREARAPDEGDLEERTEQLLATARDLRVVPNRGVCGEIEGQRYWLGEANWVVAETGAEGLTPPVTRDEPGGWLLLADSKAPLAWFGFQFALRSDAADTLRRLRARGIEPSLLSGDASLAEVARVAAELDVRDVRGGASPEQKAETLEALQRGGAVVAAVGDGINDAPILSRAHVSIAMAEGADLARVSADAILLGERLGAVDTAVGWARKTRRVIRQNLAWAIGYNLSILPLAACGFLPPYLAAIGMSLSSLLVVGNALRLADLREAP